MCVWFFVFLMRQGVLNVWLWSHKIRDRWNYCWLKSALEHWHAEVLAISRGDEKVEWVCVLFVYWNCFLLDPYFFVFFCILELFVLMWNNEIFLMFVSVILWCLCLLLDEMIFIVCVYVMWSVCFFNWISWQSQVCSQMPSKGLSVQEERDASSLWWEDEGCCSCEEGWRRWRFRSS